jgi:hypothetical protein
MGLAQEVHQPEKVAMSCEVGRKEDPLVVEVE